MTVPNLLQADTNVEITQFGRSSWVKYGKQSMLGKDLGDRIAQKLRVKFDNTSKKTVNGSKRCNVTIEKDNDHYSITVNDQLNSREVSLSIKDTYNYETYSFHTDKKATSNPFLSIIYVDAAETKIDNQDATTRINITLTPDFVIAIKDETKVPGVSPKNVVSCAILL